MIEWTSQFEGFPTDADFGSVMGQVLRDTKQAVLERLENEHEVDLTSTAVVSHKPGKCTVVRILNPSDTLAGLLVEGALTYKEGALYRDNGSSLDLVGVGDHDQLAGLSDNDHPQFFRVTGSDSLNGDFTVPGIEGLPTSEYFGPTQVMSKSHENQDSVDGGARHSDEILSRSDISIGLDKASVSDETLTYNPASADTSYTIDLPEYSGAIFLTQGTSNTWFTPDLHIKCTTTDNDDYHGRAQLHFKNSGSFEVKYKRLVN